MFYTKFRAILSLKFHQLLIKAQAFCQHFSQIIVTYQITEMNIQRFSRIAMISKINISNIIGQISWLVGNTKLRFVLLFSFH